MLFWIIVAVLTAAVAVALLLPLMRAGSRVAPAGRHDAEVYRDQLEELKRDAASGLISGTEAETARAEVARRLMAASAASEKTDVPRPAGPNRLAQTAIVIVLPLVGLCLYVATGSPAVPDAPLAARIADPGNDIEILIARAERQLSTHPEDGAGWDILAPVYYRSGRIDDAVAAYSNAIRINGPTQARLGGYAESLIARSGGLVVAEARKALEQSLAIAPGDPKARFYLALGLEQEGKGRQALAAYREIVRTSPTDAPWLPLVNDHMARLEDGPSPAPGQPTPADIANAQALEPGDRRAMIEGMVASLAAKLKSEPENLDGWLRIIRSYTVLGDPAKAVDALREGLNAFPRDGEGGRQLLALAGELGLEPGLDTETIR